MSPNDEASNNAASEPLALTPVHPLVRITCSLIYLSPLLPFPNHEHRIIEVKVATACSSPTDACPPPNVAVAVAEHVSVEARDESDNLTRVGLLTYSKGEASLESSINLTKHAALAAVSSVWLGTLLTISVHSPCVL
jgi:hypothetical protein